MGDVVNLRMARKARTRAADVQAAEQNRARFGRTKSEKEAAAIEAARIARIMDGARREE